jgi:hypothetical protein
MDAVLPIDVPNVDQAEVCLVDQGCRLNRVVWPFVLKMPARDPVQFGIGELDDLSHYGLVPRTPSAEEMGDPGGPFGPNFGSSHFSANYTGSPGFRLEVLSGIPASTVRGPICTAKRFVL